jgi:hypothetical protein
MHGNALHAASRGRPRAAARLSPHTLLPHQHHMHLTFSPGRSTRARARACARARARAHTHTHTRARARTPTRTPPRTQHTHTHAHGNPHDVMVAPAVGVAVQGVKYQHVAPGAWPRGGERGRGPQAAVARGRPWAPDTRKIGGSSAFALPPPLRAALCPTPTSNARPAMPRPFHRCPAPRLPILSRPSPSTPPPPPTPVAGARAVVEVGRQQHLVKQVERRRQAGGQAARERGDLLARPRLALAAAAVCPRRVGVRGGGSARRVRGAGRRTGGRRPMRQRPRVGRRRAAPHASAASPPPPPPSQLRRRSDRAGGRASQ